VTYLLHLLWFQRVLILCGQRMILFDNKTKDDEKKTKQVHELLKLIDLVRKQNNNIPYTDEMYHMIKVKEFTTFVSICIHLSRCFEC